MDNTNSDTNLIDVHEAHNREDEEEEEYFEYVNDNKITEE